MSNNTVANHARFPVLDALRGCAAIFVAQRHLADDFWAGNGFFRTYLAVDLFFVLSGFVIAAAYSSRLESGKLSAKQFMLVRWIRLYPMYFLATLLAIVAVVPSVRAAVSHGGHVWAVLAMTSMATLVFLPSHWMGGILLFSLNGPFWSLFFELIINSAYAVTAKAMNTTRLIFVILGALVLMILLALAIDTGLDSGWGWAWPHVFIGVARALFGIGAGILLFRMRPGLMRAARMTAKFPVFLGALVPLATVILVMMATPSMHAFDVPFDIFVCVVVFPLSVLLATFIDWTNRGFLLLCSILGSISYPIYLLHVPVGKLIQTLAPTLGETYPATAGWVVLAFLMTLSYAAEKVYEIPVRRWLNQHVLRPS